LLERERGIAAIPGVVDGSAHARVHVLGQVLDDVPELVHLAALHECRLAEEIADRAPQGFGAVDHPQPRARGVKAPIDELGKQCLHHRRVLGAAFAKSENVLSSLGIDPQGD
jgi:hypothetical protein